MSDYYDDLDEREKGIWHVAEAEGNRKGFGCGLITAFLLLASSAILKALFS